MSTLLRDIIDIPEHYGAEDYVLKLTNSIGDDAARRTLDAYVVTPALADAFDTALGVVADAVTSRESRGAFLTGSFGSGKSHFMAVLHALLRRDPAARAKTELQPAIAKHDPSLDGKKVLPLAFHLLASSSMEQALFDGYVRQVRELHPGAPLPAVHRTDALLADAENLRANLGDDAFFTRLRGTAGDDTGDTGDSWGDVLDSGAWDLARYTEARAAAPGSTSRQELVSALVDHYFTSFTGSAEYVDIDTGLAAIAEHAQGLGYDAVVLFLDELVLWLAFAVQDRSFFQRESQKITKLVESTTGRRAIPLVSFVARQMDLRRWLADSGASGLEQDALDSAFKHQEGRFTTIVLGDDNLPFVAHQRLLQPRDAAAAEQLQDAFRRIDRRENVWKVLLDGMNTDERHPGSDEEAFRLTYPFSPALVSTLRSLASVMQRERTALKVMQRMLVDRRDELTIDEIIPVGDAFDIIVQSESGQPLDARAAARFRSALKLYTEKLRPAILASKQLDESTLATAPEATQRQVAVDDRLAKTLLLSAVAPDVPALKNLTPQRLASLNHGSIVSPLPNGEAGVVNSTVRQWAREVPELRLDGDYQNPTITVQLAEIDYESIVEKAKQADNEGRRQELVIDIVSTAIGLQRSTASGLHHDSVDHVWRGTRRRVEVVFGNVRDSSRLSDDAFRSTAGTWRIVIDHPFDEAGHSSTEDFARIEGLKTYGMRSETLVWLPRFLSDATMRDLRRLVILDYLLAEGPTGRWTSYADHLSEGNRMQAAAILDGQRTNLRHSVEEAIQQAYGIVSPLPGVLDDEARSTFLFSFDTRFDPQAPDGTTLGSAFAKLADDAYAASFPKHPVFAPGNVEVRPRDYKLVAEVVAAASEDPLKRVSLATMPSHAAAVRRIAGPLGIASVNDQFAVFGDTWFTPWGNEISRRLGARGADTNAPVTVRELREWIRGTDTGAGLPVEAVDLVIVTFAMLRQMGWRQGITPVTTAPDPGKLLDVLELRPEPLPGHQEWEQASTKASHLLGTQPVRPVASPSALSAFEKDVKDRLLALTDVPDLVTAVERAYARLGMSGGDRLRTAQTTGALYTRLKELKGVTLVEALATLPAEPSPQAGGTSLRSAADVTARLGAFPWERLEPLETAAQGEGPRADSAAALLTDLRTALAADEFVHSAATALAQAEKDAFAWVVAQSQAPTPAQPLPVAPPVTTPSPTGGATGRRPAATVRRRAGDRDDAVVTELAAFLAAHPDATVTVTWSVDE